MSTADNREIETDVNLINEAIQMRLHSKIKDLEQGQAEKHKAMKDAK